MACLDYPSRSGVINPDVSSFYVPSASTQSHAQFAASLFSYLFLRKVLAFAELSCLDVQWPIYNLFGIKALMLSTLKVQVECILPHFWPETLCTPPLVPGPFPTKQVTLQLSAA